MHDKNVPRREILYSEWLAIAKKLFNQPADMAFRCVRCGHEQSISSAKAAGVDVSSADAWIYFSCEGRRRKGVGCDWSLGGFLRIHNLEIIDDRPGQDMVRVPAFDFATASVVGRPMQNKA